MKKSKILISGIIVFNMLTLSSCGINHALQINQNASVTNVTLSSANYKVIDRVKGQSSQEYILGVGGISKTSLYANAKADLMNNANFNGSSKALINIISEEHVGGVPPFYLKRTVTYSADVIEFNK